MPATDLTSWYVTFGIGAVGVFAVVVAVTVMLQLTTLIAGQLTDTRATLMAIRTATAAIPAMRDINADVRQLNTTLAETREHLSQLLEVSTS